ncbi:hypothetical protein GCK72_019014 [Caenorhabditis remanei]|uniref:Uncharacterized protein n=1 Tax=Caenorhabditis remanei TaxID=31234 RepID=A0A6A5GDF8_CAERE|nr:hypothetical protein GCK72_019014 [Caenorhabditis remanei]KAF1752459.1 hypothetical protein GCK72_019014 [Caenorhabditis remanei]
MSSTPSNSEVTNSKAVNLTQALPVQFFLEKIIKLAIEIAPEITGTQLAGLLELKNDAIAVCAHSNGLLQVHFTHLATKLEIMTKNMLNAEKGHHDLVAYYKETIAQLQKEKEKLQREIEISNMLDDLEKELAAKKI